jgi:hypothetical protein
MGRRGPRRKLAEIDRLEGNPGRRRLIEETGVEALGSPFIPEHLSDDARGCIDNIKQSIGPRQFHPVGVRDGMGAAQARRARDRRARLSVDDRKQARQSAGEPMDQDCKSASWNIGGAG